MKKNVKGITLIGLIATIIVLLILVGVVISLVMGDNGLLHRTESAVVSHNKGKYFEEINMDIYAAQADWSESHEEGSTFMSCLGDRIVRDRDWAESYECDEENGILTIITSDGNEIPMTINNEKATASINTADVTIGETIECTITYDANTGTGSMDEQKANRGTNAILSNNSFTKDGFSFKEWNTLADGSGESYNAGSKLKISKDTTLYAIWNDGTPPVITSITGSVGNVTFAAKDDQSGIIGYAITDTNERPETFTAWNGASKTEAVTNNTDHYLWIENGDNLVADSQRFKIHHHDGVSSAKGGCYQIENRHTHSTDCYGPHHTTAAWVNGAASNGRSRYYKVRCTYCWEIYDNIYLTDRQKSDVSVGKSWGHCTSNELTCGCTNNQIVNYSTNCGYSDGQLITTFE